MQIRIYLPWFNWSSYTPRDFATFLSLKVLKSSYLSGFFLNIVLLQKACGFFFRFNSLIIFPEVYPSSSWREDSNLRQCHKPWVYWVHFSNVNGCNNHPPIHQMKSPSKQKDSRRLMTSIKWVSFAWRWISAPRSQQNHIFHYVQPAERISLISLSSRAQSYHITQTK